MSYNIGFVPLIILFFDFVEVWATKSLYRSCIEKNVFQYTFLWLMHQNVYASIWSITCLSKATIATQGALYTEESQNNGTQACRIIQQFDFGANGFCLQVFTYISSHLQLKQHTTIKFITASRITQHYQM